MELLPTCSKEKGKGKVVYYIVLSLLCLALTFIYVNSCLPWETSSAESDAVSRPIADATSEESFLVKNLRKIAHFVEFGALGVLSAMLFMYEKEKRKRFHALIIFGLLSGFIDESIQLLSKRGSSTLDIWLDFSGFVFFSLLTLGIFMLTHFLKTRKSLDGDKRNG